jgi:8-oxo-dGTP diphosphatase
MLLFCNGWPDLLPDLLFVSNSEITLSREHSEYQFHAIDTLYTVQKQRVLACLNFDGTVVSDKF